MIKPITESQLRNIIKEYVEYYNKKRPHQGTAQRIPKDYKFRENGKVKSNQYYLD